MRTTVRKSELELRKVLAKTLQKLMTENREVVYLEGDLAGAIGTDGLFAAFPEQAFDVGIMEANMVGAAAGMSIRKDPLCPQLRHVRLAPLRGSGLPVRLL